MPTQCDCCQHINVVSISMIHTLWLAHHCHDPMIHLDGDMVIFPEHTTCREPLLCDLNNICETDGAIVLVKMEGVVSLLLFHEPGPKIHCHILQQAMRCLVISRDLSRPWSPTSALASPGRTNTRGSEATTIRRVEDQQQQEEDHGFLMKHD
jgi:hypothetical protein